MFEQLPVGIRIPPTTKIGPKVPTKGWVIDRGLNAPFSLSETLGRQLIRTRVPGVSRDAHGKIHAYCLRCDPTLVSLVRKLGKLSCTGQSELIIVDVPITHVVQIKQDEVGREYLLDNGVKRTC